MKKVISIVILSTAISVGVMSAVMAVRDMYFGQRFGAVDIESILATQVATYGPLEADATQKEKIALAVSSALQSSIHEVENEHRVLLLVKAAVITESVPDYTEIIKSKLASHLEDINVKNN